MPKSVSVKVITFDSELELVIQSSTIGKQLFDEVVKNLGIREIMYFGLQYVDTKGLVAWLKLNKKILSQDIGRDEFNTLHFKFRVKFYPEDVSEELIQEITQRYFFQQVKESILTEEIFCPPETAVLLASLACQAKFGDYIEDIHDANFLSEEKLLPTRFIEQHKLTEEKWISKILSWWHEHGDMLKENAVMEYLKIAQDLEMYGVNYFHIRNKKNTDLLLGIDAMGINIYSAVDKLVPKIAFPWSEVGSISFSDKKFMIKPNDKKAPDFVFFTNRLRINKRILALCIGNHDLYVRRRQEDSIERKQLKAQAELDKEMKRESRERWKKEKTAREMAEQQLVKMEARLYKEVDEREAALKEAEEYQTQVSHLEEKLCLERDNRIRLEKMKAMLEENNRELSQTEAAASEDKERLIRERKEIEEEISRKSASYEKSLMELKEYKQQLKYLKSERMHLEEKNQRAQQQLIGVKEDSVDDNSNEYGHTLHTVSTQINDDLPETMLQKNTRLHSQLKALSSELKHQRDSTKMVPVDFQNDENQRMGRDKFKTLQKIRMGNTKKRIDEFEAL